MRQAIRQSFERARIYLLVGAVSLASGTLLFLPEWVLPTPRLWNALAAFAILGIVCDSFSFTIPFAKVTTSVGFIPLIASIVLFQHPWPMVIAGVTAVVVDAL